MVIWFVIIKKEEFVESILIGYNVLMITNRNDLYIWACWPNRLKTGVYFECATVNWLQLRTGWDQDSYNVCKNRIRSCPQLRLTDDSQNRLRSGSQGDLWDRLAAATRNFQATRCFKNLCNFYWLIFFIDSCVNAKQESLNCIHTEKRFSGKGLEHYLRNRLRTMIKGVPKLKRNNYQVT